MINEKVAGRFIVATCAAAAIAGLLTLLMSVFGAYGFSLWNLLDVAAWFGLGYGVYRKSRTCAIILLTYHLVNRVDMWTRTHAVSTTIGGFAIPFAVIYCLGILGTFAHHAILEKEKRQP